MARIVGIDEVGRGAWAGPLVIGAVLLDDTKPIAGLRDSKLLSKKQRSLCNEIVHAKSLAWGVGLVEAEEIDTIGLSAAMALAIRRALSYITLPYDEIIIDGNFNYLPDNPKARAQIKADMTINAASAASIIAKVARDQLMTEYVLTWPEHGFDRHVGYGTALHRAMLDLYGITPLHRKSFKPIAAYGNA